MDIALLRIGIGFSWEMFHAVSSVLCSESYRKN